MTDVPRRALRQPRCLAPEQLASLDIINATQPARVQAWILWEDGVEELVTGQAVAWTKRAVKIRWGSPPHVLETWVWAGAVERLPG